MAVEHAGHVLAGNRLQKRVRPHCKCMAVNPFLGLRRNVHENKFQAFVRIQLALQVINLVQCQSIAGIVQSLFTLIPIRQFVIACCNKNRHIRKGFLKKGQKMQKLILPSGGYCIAHDQAETRIGDCDRLR